MAGAAPVERLGAGLALAAFTAAIFAAAALLFVLEPMFASMLLPRAGGAAAVWNTAVVFFQAVLLAGYAYADWLSRFGQRRQLAIHAAVLGLAALALPVRIAAGSAPPSGAGPTPWLLLTMTAAVGPPFFALSATSPLFQRWFAATGHPHARDPYFLYAASNLGSLLALLAYPFLLAARLGLSEQSNWWTAAYAGFAVLALGCAAALVRRPAAAANAAGPGNRETGAATPALSWAQRLRWLALAAVPSTWLLALTSFCTTEVLPMPLLWVIPLAVYLASFAVVFARRPLLPHAGLVRALPFAVLAVLAPLMLGATGPLWLLAPVHLGAFAVAALVCHGEIARTRPPARRLTEFYLLVAAGGVLGGAFATLAAPLLFPGYAEYPLAVIAACLLAPTLSGRPRPAWADALLPAALGLGAAALAVLLHLLGIGRAGAIIERTAPALAGQVLLFAIPAAVCFSFSRRPVRFGLGVAAMALAGLVPQALGTDLAFVQRDFYGVHSVEVVGARHVLRDGSVIHGLQDAAPGRRDQPTAYYARTGPLGDVFAAVDREDAGWRVGEVGLGSGATACYARAGQRWTFYEIDPTVARIALDPRLFTFVRDCLGDRPDIRLGDGRLLLERARPAEYDLLLLDAFGGESIPVHLVTREAVATYLSRLAPGGLVVFHISNQYVDLRPVLAELCDDARLACLARAQAAVTPAEAEAGAFPSSWFVMARTRADLRGLAGDARWTEQHGDPGDRPWTDDYSDLGRRVQL